MDSAIYSRHKHGPFPEGVYNPVRSEVNAIADVGSGTGKKSNRWVTFSCFDPVCFPTLLLRK